ncbi:MAG: galactose-1-phosphate uridylyltransferase [Verrucomicrobiota bacterium]
MRLDPLTDEWTLFSEARAYHPTADSVLPEIESGAASNPFLAGREKYAPRSLHESTKDGAWRVRVVPNRTPMLQVEGDPSRQAAGFYDRMTGVGAHEVIVETPDHRAFETLDLKHIEEVITAWKVRVLDLMHDMRMRSFSVVKSVGRPAGALVAHSLSQLIAMAVIPSRLKRKLESAQRFYELKKRSIFQDILSEEVRTGDRIVYENHGFMVFCPYASRTPFELAIYPKRQNPDFHAIHADEIAQLADALRIALSKLNGALDFPPYHLMLTTAPTRTARHDQWGSIDRDFRWHIEILPRLYPMGAFELATGSWANSVWPEAAAEYLRTIEVSV